MSSRTIGDSGTERRTSLYQLRRAKAQLAENDWTGPPFNVIYAGLAARFHLLTGVTIAVAVRDSTYLLDFAQYTFTTSNQSHYQAEISQFIVEKMRDYQEQHGEKFIGLAMPTDLAERCPDLCTRLWSELDVIPIVLRKSEEKLSWGMFEEHLPHRSLDEHTESIARKCIRFFGPTHAPVPEIGSRGLVEVDAAFHVQITTLADYKKTVGTATWAAIQKYASDLQKRRVKVAFFSATPQGGGVALMRHAMVRFAKVLGVDLRWYVPRPRHGIFRITKNNHNILQGVAPPGLRFTAADKNSLRDWVIDNAERYWFKGIPLPPWLEQFSPHAYTWISRYGPPHPAWFEKNGPLVPPWEGGADVVVIDDPQLPWLIPLIKARTPQRPVIFRSHIQIRSDLVDTPGTPQAEAWEFLWEAISKSDIFVSHPVRAFVPQVVPRQKLGYLPASTDWLDGLNKPMTDWTASHYGRIFNAKCREQYMPNIGFPKEDYIVQIARFDPSKGIQDVLISYEKFHKQLARSRPDLNPPKLLICGHGSVDDPDGSIVYDAALEFIEQHLQHIRNLICVMRIGPSDQMLHALLSRAKIALQLSTREGFEVKVSEALHMGKPVIATLAGGIPLQIQHGKNGFLVKPGDTDTVSGYLFSLYTDHEMYDRISKYAAGSVSDEVSTVGNTLSWLFLASKLSNGEHMEPNGRWINDMAREEAGEPYGPEEYRLERTLAA
ncbi:UDP-Glycosyltransferase/glycogen phosphorylase [Aspergillus eucalypticola CBS 122712]|uniref:UDP-Glycosyltransferase/glycogen phosphorylase n=1 Tax=Aspergillus eucalypticola (strain CBS 122712 / IBT 29274) TaxID=1448314 RepID=A0A317VQR6_ASPEC|nr:UDP-Glycosyltransferase/glycogen phosphorylase [Aspergillus eucalypticola CBS 122712]PWY75899.1 UDP-Glycosyltransferase/glycogen phosphorylase [Aspergillus eucalypticola CBS 122712]